MGEKVIIFTSLVTNLYYLLHFWKGYLFSEFREYYFISLEYRVLDFQVESKKFHFNKFFYNYIVTTCKEVTEAFVFERIFGKKSNIFINSVNHISFYIGITIFLA